MNPLKERRTVTTTKAITTLFISSVLLVGFIGMSLSLSQIASATREGPPADRPQDPQCQPGERFEPGEGCIAKVCPNPGEGETVKPDPNNPDKCIITKTTTTTVNKVPGPCPADKPILKNNECFAEHPNKPGTAVGSGSPRPLVCPAAGEGETVKEDPNNPNKCIVTKTTTTIVDKIDAEPRKPGRGNL